VPEASTSVYSLSKAYVRAGTRVGYRVGPPALVAQTRKIGTHNYYSAPTPGQYGALAALSGGSDWLRDAREQYASVGREAARRLGIAPPAGSTFLFLDVSHRLDERGLGGFLEDCYDDGVLVAPGASGGAAYGRWIRLCYTAAEPADTLAAIDRLAARLYPGSAHPRSSP